MQTKPLLYLDLRYYVVIRHSSRRTFAHMALCYNNTKKIYSPFRFVFNYNKIVMKC